VSLVFVFVLCVFRCMPLTLPFPSSLFLSLHLFPTPSLSPYFSYPPPIIPPPSPSPYPSPPINSRLHPLPSLPFPMHKSPISFCSPFLKLQHGFLISLSNTLSPLPLTSSTDPSASNNPSATKSPIPIPLPPPSKTALQKSPQPSATPLSSSPNG
jgi:hypothetical protein